MPVLPGAPAPPPAPAAAARARWRRWWPWLQRALILALVLAGGVQLIDHLRDVDWPGMWRAVLATPGDVLWWAAVLTIAKYAVYAVFDLLGCRYMGLPLGRARVFTIGLVCHAYGLTLGPLAAAFRFRLYMSLGVGAAATAGVWFVTVASNWLGFTALAGVAFATGFVTAPPQWGLGRAALQWLGVAMLLLPIVYLAACALPAPRVWRLRGRDLRLPSLRFALLQAVLSVLNWLLLTGVLFVLMEPVAFGKVLGGLIVTSLALAIVDVPGALGVIETVFLTLLEGEISATRLLAALVVYRAVHFIAPLLIALPVTLLLEWRARGDEATRGEASQTPVA